VCTAHLPRTFLLTDPLPAEIRLRALGVERAGLVKPGGDDAVYVGIQRHKRKAGGSEADPATSTWEGKLIYRRKWFYLGRFRSQVEAASA